MTTLIEDAKVLGGAVRKAHQLLEVADLNGELEQCVSGMCLPSDGFDAEDTPKKVFQMCLVQLLSAPLYAAQKERYIHAFLYAPRDVQDYVIWMLREMADCGSFEDYRIARQLAKAGGVKDGRLISKAFESMRACCQNTVTVLEALVEDER